MSTTRRSRKPTRSFYAMSDDEDEARRKRQCYEDISDDDDDESIDEKIAPPLAKKQNRTACRVPSSREVPTTHRVSTHPAAMLPSPQAPMPRALPRLRKPPRAPPQAPTKRAPTGPTTTLLPSTHRTSAGDETTKLGMLAVELSAVLKTQPRRCITVEDASEILQQNRRRLYDAIHVLSGAGVVRVEKIKVKGPDGKIMGKDVTMIHWVNRAAPKTAEHLRLEELDQESKNLDAWLQHCRTARTKLNLKMLHVSKDLLLTKQARNNEAGAALPRHPGRGPSQSESVDLVLAPPPGSVLNVNPPFADTDGYSFQVSVPIGTSSKQKTQSPIPISAYIMEGGKLHNLLPPRPLLSPTSSGTPHIGESQKRSEPFVSLSPPDRRDGSLDESCLDFRPGSPHLAYCSSDLHFQSTASGPGISPTPEATTPALMTPSSPLTPLAVTPLLSSTTSDLWRLLSPEMPLNKAELESHLSNKTGTSSSYLSPTVCQSSNHNVTPRDQSQGVGTGHLPMDLITPAATVSSPPPATVTPPFSRSISELLKLMQPPPPTSLALDGMSPPDKKSATSLDPVFPCDALEQDPLLLAALANMGEL